MFSFEQISWTGYGPTCGFKEEPEASGARLHFLDTVYKRQGHGEQNSTITARFYNNNNIYILILSILASNSAV